MYLFQLLRHLFYQITIFCTRSKYSLAVNAHSSFECRILYATFIVKTTKTATIIVIAIPIHPNENCHSGNVLNIHINPLIIPMKRNTKDTLNIFLNTVSLFSLLLHVLSFPLYVPTVKRRKAESAQRHARMPLRRSLYFAAVDCRDIERKDKT